MGCDPRTKAQISADIQVAKAKLAEAKINHKRAKEQLKEERSKGRLGNSSLVDFYANQMASCARRIADLQAQKARAPK